MRRSCSYDRWPRKEKPEIAALNMWVHLSQVFHSESWSDFSDVGDLSALKKNPKLAIPSHFVISSIVYVSGIQQNEKQLVSRNCGFYFIADTEIDL